MIEHIATLSYKEIITMEWPTVNTLVKNLMPVMG